MYPVSERCRTVVCALDAFFISHPSVQIIFYNFYLLLVRNLVFRHKFLPLWIQCFISLSLIEGAYQLAELTGGELYKIEQEQPYSEGYKTCIAEAKADLQKKARPEVLNLPDDLDAYDEIYLGYPNYWGTMPMAVYTFLEHYDFTGKTIHPFCTHEGSGLSHTVQDIQKAAPQARVTKGLAIHGSSVDGAKAALENWIQEVH